MGRSERSHRRPGAQRRLAAGQAIGATAICTAAMIALMVAYPWLVLVLLVQIAVLSLCIAGAVMIDWVVVRARARRGHLVVARAWARRGRPNHSRKR